MVVDEKSVMELFGLKLGFQIYSRWMVIWSVLTVYVFELVLLHREASNPKTKLLTTYNLVRKNPNIIAIRTDEIVVRDLVKQFTISFS